MQIPVRANGNIKIASFVKIDTTTDNTVVQATAATSPIFGIAQRSPNIPPLPGATTTLAAAAGEQLIVFQVGDVCLLQAGSAGWTAGDLLTAGSDGLGKAATSGNYYGAEAVADAASGELVMVKVQFGKI